VWGRSSNDVYAVGEGTFCIPGFAGGASPGLHVEGVVLNYDGSSWNQLRSYTFDDLLGVRGIQSDLFAVGGVVGGGPGIILSYESIASDPAETSFRETVRHVWRVAANDVFAVGDRGTIIRYGP